METEGTQPPAPGDSVAGVVIGVVVAAVAVVGLAGAAWLLISDAVLAPQVAARAQAITPLPAAVDEPPARPAVAPPARQDVLDTFAQAAALEGRQLREDQLRAELDARERAREAAEQKQREAQRAPEIARSRAQDSARDAKRKAMIKDMRRERGKKRARSRVQIVMYSTHWCGVCKRARRYFEEHDIRVTERFVEDDAAAKAIMRRLNPRGSVPTILIDDEVLIGFRAARFEKMLEEAVKERAKS